MRTLIEPLAGSPRALVFGAVWSSTIGANPEKQARIRARKARAQFYTRARTRSTVVGLLILRHAREKPAKTLTLYSAAAAFAHAYDRGSVAVCLPLRDGGFWVSAAVDGMVQIGSDVIHDTPQAAQQQLEQLRQQHPALQVYGSDAGQTPLGEGVFLDHLTDATAMRRVTSSIFTLPLTAWLILGALAALLVWHVVSERRAAQQQALHEAERQTHAVDAVAAWRAALQTWAQAQAMHGMAAVTAMLESVARLPVAPGRWELDTVDCQPALCQALYRRTRLADTPSLQAALPPDWRIQWLDMDNARVTVPTHWVGTQRGDLAAMPGEQAYVQDVLTHWQRLKPAMEDIRIGAKTPVDVPAPLAPNADGSPAPLPFPVQSAAQSGLIRPFVREITLHAPLRTIAALALPDQTQILLLQVRRRHAEDADLNHSAFHAMLKGVMYVQ